MKFATHCVFFTFCAWSQLLPNLIRRLSNIRRQTFLGYHSDKPGGDWKGISFCDVTM